MSKPWVIVLKIRFVNLIANLNPFEGQILFVSNLCLFNLLLLISSRIIKAKEPRDGWGLLRLKTA